MESVYRILKNRKEMYDVMPEHLRTAKNNGARYFKKCEWCGYDCSKEETGETIFLANEYRHRFGLVLCDRCVDKFNSVANGNDVDEYWTPKAAMEDNLPPFNYDIPPHDKTRDEELRNCKRDWDKR